LAQLSTFKIKASINYDALHWHWKNFMLQYKKE
jgi:hypothetical protein